MDYERTRLVQAGKPNLADWIEHTSVEEGDGAGFDIRSYETDGSPDAAAGGDLVRGAGFMTDG